MHIPLFEDNGHHVRKFDEGKSCEHQRSVQNQHGAILHNKHLLM